MRTFYLGKPIINPADSVNFYIRGNKTLEDYEKMDYKSMPTSSIDGRHLDIDENILKAEQELYGSDAISFDAYKKIRSESENSFGKSMFMEELQLQHPNHLTVENGLLAFSAKTI